TEQNPFTSIRKTHHTQTRSDGITREAGSRDADMIRTQHGWFTAIILCRTTIEEVTYSMRNGSVSQFQSQPANKTLTAILSGALLADGLFVNKIKGDEEQAMLLETTNDMAVFLADAYSRNIVAISSAAMKTVTSTREWTTSSKIVARIPKAPFWTLV